MVLCRSETHLLFCAVFVVSEFVEEGLLAAVVPPYSVNVAFHF